MNKYYFPFFVLICTFSFAQIKGIVTDKAGNPISNVTVLEENTYNGTATNENGKYELKLGKTENSVLVFRHLGFKTQKISVTIKDASSIQNIQLLDDNLFLSEVVIKSKNNPANAIIKKAIASKKQNAEKTARFTADFYSRGIFKLKDVPKKFLGKKVGDFNGSLDSTGTGIIYLSETVSKISYKKPNNLKETIIASKVSGDTNGFSFNTAKSSFFDCYDNTVDLGNKIISPIANNAFAYYKYKLEGKFQDENNQTIHKIKIIAKRDTEPVFEGYIFIVADSWAIYAIDLVVKGYRMQQEFIDEMSLKQNFSYNQDQKTWAKSTQSLAFSAGIFGVKVNGKFSYVFSNYKFEKEFAKKTFTNEIVSFEGNANKKDTFFWNTIRPIPLTLEESNDYKNKDSLYIIKNSVKYLDSIDKKSNKFKMTSPFFGYYWKNSKKKKSFKFNGLLTLGSLSFNTVQGRNLSTGFSFRDWKQEEEKGKFTSITSQINYGFSENRFRGVATYFHQFNNQNYASLSVFGGSKVSQFNPDEPISKLINAVSTLFFKENYVKLYHKEFFAATYSQDVGNNFHLKGTLEYSQRNHLFNTSSNSFFKSEKIYTSNNPLLPDDYVTPIFDKHHLTKFSFLAKIHFGNKYISRPNGKVNISNKKYPTLFLGYENAFASNDKKYQFQSITGQVRYDFDAQNKGILGINLKTGTFVNAKNSSFADYKHFNGNQTHVGTSERYLNVFNLLPYYSNSTNKSYLESHLEYDDKGFFMNKIPVLNKLKSNLVLGFHSLSVQNNKPYSEYTIGLDHLGFGKFKVFRVDFVQSSQNGKQVNGVVFGLKILNLLN